MAIAPLFKAAVLFCSRRDVRDAVRDVLKKMGVTDVAGPSSADDCIEELKKDPDTLLVIDWEVGGPEVTKVFEAVKGSYRIETRPIFLLAGELTPRLIAFGYEYAVMQTHTGPISQAKIKEYLIEISQHEKVNGPLKQVLTKVSEARQKNKWDVATKLLETMAEKLAGNPRIAVELAENMFRDEKWEEVLKLLEPFTVTQPPYARALHLMGRCLMKLGRFAEASLILNKAKLLNPFNVARLIDLGNSLLRSNEIEQAKENFSEAAKLDGTNKEAKVGTGQCMLLEGDVNEALIVLKDISDQHELASIFNTSAIMSIRAGRFKDGMALYDAACLAISGNSKIVARLTFNKGLGYQRQRRDAEALNFFKEALALDGQFVKARRCYADVLKKLGHEAPPGAEALANESFEEQINAKRDSEATVAEHQSSVKDSLGLDFPSDNEFDKDVDEESITFV